MLLRSREHTLSIFREIYTYYIEGGETMKDWTFTKLAVATAAVIGLIKIIK
jgi:hypothetical protein